MTASWWCHRLFHFHLRLQVLVVCLGLLVVQRQLFRFGADSRSFCVDGIKLSLQLRECSGVFRCAVAAGCKLKNISNERNSKKAE